MRRTAIFTALVLLAATASLAEETSGVDILRSIQEAFTSVAAEVSPAVVYIEVKSETDKSLSFFFGPWGFEAPPEQEAAGSGFIIDAEGYVLTNAHVVARAKEIQVTLADDRAFDAEVVGIDPDSDLALLRLKDADNLPVVRLGDSDKVRVGEWALAIGSPFGLQQTVTAGIISATGRTNMGLANYEDFIQTDASINPGNSGGALVDLNGNVVGIPTAIIPFAQGIGFAVSADVAKQIAERLISTGKAPYLGVSHRAPTPEDVGRLRVPDGKGTLVAMVEPNGPAAAAGVKPGDVILQVGERRIGTAKDLGSAVRSHDVGTRVPITVWRDGRKVTLEATLGAVPEQGIR